jgi:hypothetical protein
MKARYCLVKMANNLPNDSVRLEVLPEGLIKGVRLAQARRAERRETGVPRTLCWHWWSVS